MSQQFDLVYPNGVDTRQTSSSHSDGGSFGTAFIVLAIVLVVSVTACVVGRLCSRRRHHDSGPKQPQMPPMRSGLRGESSSSRQNRHDFPPKEEAGGDIEFGFGNKHPIPTSKVAASEGFKEFKPPSPNGEANGQGRSPRGPLLFKPVIRPRQ